MISRSFSTFREDTSAASASFFRDTASCPWAQARYLPKRRARRVMTPPASSRPRPPAARPMVGNRLASRAQLRPPVAAPMPSTRDTSPANSNTRPTIFMFRAACAEYWGVLVTFRPAAEAVPGRAWDGLGFARDTAGSLRDTVDRVLRAAFFRRESFPSTFDSSTASPAGHATMNRKMIRIQDPRSLSSFRGGLGGGDCRNSRSRSS